MGEPIVELIAHAGFYRCILLVHPDVSRPRQEAVRLALANGWPTLTIGPSLVAVLLSTSMSQRPDEAEGVLHPA